MEVQMRLILFYIVIVSSVSEEVKENLTGTEGGSVTLPDPVFEFGFLIFKGTNIAMVSERKVTHFQDDRVLWNNKTGLFTITRLQRNDSGNYNIDSKTGRVSVSSFKLTVYASLPTPTVNTLIVSAESCTLLCFVKEAEETKLLWYKDEEIVYQNSSALSQPLTVHKQDLNSSYRCVAANPAEEKTVLVDVREVCGGQESTDNKEIHYHIGLVIAIVFACAIIVLIGLFIMWKYSYKSERTTSHRQDSDSREPSVQYTDIRILEKRRQVGPPQGGRLPDSSGQPDNLTTIYDKLQVHRMGHRDTADL